MSNSSNNKRIAKNTLFLYIRMFLIMGISFYSSRILLATLGASDYGLFNVVAGIITLFAVVNTALAGCTQRFFTIAIGERIYENILKVFRVSLLIHIIVAIAFYVIMESIGYYLLEYVINIPNGRESAAMVVYHFALLACCVELFRALYDAIVISYERMSFYAYISIFESILRLIIIFIIDNFETVDSLKLYSLLYFLSSFIIMIIYALYCHKKYDSCKFKPLFDEKLFCEIGSYTGWNIVSHLGFVLSSQGINIALNNFCGTVLNAARGIASQVYAIVGKFVINFQTASQPQIIKLYAGGNYEEMYSLTKNVAKFSGFLFFLLGVPLILEAENLLAIWLVEVPKHSAPFVIIMIIQGYIGALNTSATRVITATGRVKTLNIISTISQVISLLLFVLLLVLKINVIVAMLSILFPNVVVYVTSLWLMRRYIGLELKSYIFDVWVPNFIVLSSSVILPYICHSIFDDGFIRLILVGAVSTISILVSIYLLGVDIQTRNKINIFILSKLK